ncbi:iron-sulfur cluster assembly scaffold protein [Candidatus Woesearchaeota archaeon]|jgi:NifU-like protein involved in Fe-S cluster formation/bacterioferritin-associated ferredoxin|nr:iron-sulfur cluster assembly scaffold protein [Candidatus Woesearchaeota archaeon]|tara:strand:+ start:588 stop:1271 length:684 start_codon:yes stop_codon:yes gene_type:complete
MSEKELRIIKSSGDGESKNREAQWFYTDIVKSHFFSPKNIIKSDDEMKSFKADGIGLVGSPACGDGMKMFIKIDGKTDTVKDVKWQTYGCGTAIASTSIFSEMIKKDGGMKIDDALNIKPRDIANELGGIPARKFHCSVLADKAFREAVNDYFRKTGQKNRIVEGSAKVIDQVLKITDHDIEHAVLEGATTFEAVQKKTKVGIHDKDCISQVEELIRFYKKKYFGED